MDEMKWTKEHPHDLGVPSNIIARFIDELEKYRINIHSFSLSIGNKVIAEAYWHPFHEQFQHRMYSIGKSLTAIGIGMLEKEGHVSLDDEICRYFPEKLPASPHPYIKAMTIRHLLTMQTAHSSTTYKRYHNNDWVESFFRVTPDKRPGSFFSYDTSATHVLSALIEKHAGLPLMEFLRHHVLDEIGFSKDAKFLSDPQGVSQGGSGLVCTQNDLRNFAYLLLHGGRHREKQLIPAFFVKEATSKQVSTDFQPVFDERWGYGYNIWMARHGGFCLYGMGGQLAIAVPDSEVLFVSTADTQGRPGGTSFIHRCFWDILYPAIKEAHATGKTVPKAESFRELEKKMTSLTVAVPTITSKKLQHLDNILGEYSFPPPGQTKFREKMTLEREKDLIRLQWHNSQFSETLLFGINGPEESTLNVNSPDSNGPCYGYAAVQDDQVVELTLKRIGDLFAEISFLLAVEKDDITVRIRVIGETPLKNMDGTVLNGTKAF